MKATLLSTKFYIPALRPEFVPRPRLMERLDEGLHRKLTLVSAPAGFGKTTLVSEWVAGSQLPVAWLSLDESDNDPSQFLAYLAAALQTIDAGMGAGMLSVLQSSQPLPAQLLLTSLINEVAETPQEFIFVIDDFHLIEARPIHDALAFLLDHLPPQMHLIIATREDPDLPLARLRARGQLTELRAADLRFTPGEAATFLNQVMGLGLSVEELTSLGTRTEGWIAGLQLAALSMRGRADVAGFIRAFAGDNRYIVDYLVEEVLKRQPERVRSFLLQTAILDRLSGPLCDAVTGQADGREMLENLERGNLFVIPLDDRRRWFRYHHLFADVLNVHLIEEQPDRVPVLHQRASAWYEQNDLPADAIHHALAAEDFKRAANLIERAVPDVRRSRHEATLLGWLQALPGELLQVRPVLSVAYAWALLASGELEGVEARLQDAGRWLDTTADRREMVVVSDEEYRRLPAAIAVYRSVCAQARGDVAGAMNYARQALDLVPEDDHLVRGAAAALLGLALWASGDLETAYRTYSEGMARVLKAGNISDAISGAIARADIRIAQGHLREAMSTYEQALQLATEQGAPVLRGAADMYVGMSDLHYEHGDLNAATQYLLKSKELGEHAGLPQNPYRWRVAMARIREAQGDLDGAFDLLREAERLYAGDYSPNVRPVPALKTRVWVAQGKLDRALDWAREQGLSAHDDLSYLREFEHLTLARVLLAHYKKDRADRSLVDAMGLLERLLRAAEAGERAGSVIEILVLQALAHQMQNDIPAALAELERALGLAEPEGYARIFVNEGPPMAALLEKAAKHGIAPGYIGHILRAFGNAEDKTPDQKDLIETLSERELEVLRLLRTGLSGPEIARELIVSLNTLRTHTKNIYTKLGVNNRQAAVRRAEELNLL